MNDLDYAKQYYQAILALAVVSTVTVFLRLLARWRSTASFSADDVFIVLAWLMMLGSVINSAFSGYAP